MNDYATPFAGLTPEAILDALDSIGIHSDGRILALNSYENRVYQAQCYDNPPVIVKFYRPHRWTNQQILEEHSFIQELAEAEIPVVAAQSLHNSTLHTFKDFRFSVFRKQSGRAPELDSPEVLPWLGRLIGRIHLIGATQPFTYREQVDIEQYAIKSGEYLLSHDFIPPDIKPAYEAALTLSIDAMQACYKAAGEVNYIRTHADCHLGNILWADGPNFVDFDDCRMAPAIQDIWMFLSGDAKEMSQQLDMFLDGYEDFYQLNPRQLYLVEALRTMRLIHFSAWIARRWQDPAFPIAFPWFNTQQYWQARILELREQIALMQEPPALLLFR